MKKIFSFLFITVFLILTGGIHLSAESQKFVQKLEWTSSSNAAQYKVEIKSASSSSVTTFTTKETFVEFSMPAGKYEYRVLVYDFLGRVSKQTEWKELEILKAVQPEIKVENASVTAEKTEDNKVRIPVDAKSVNSKSVVELINEDTGKLVKGRLLIEESDSNNYGNATNAVFPEIEEGNWKLKITNPGGLTSESSVMKIGFKAQEESEEEPEEPVVEPEVPVEEPEVPVVEPEVPVEKPEEPVVEPEVPVEEPEKPVVEPEVPVVEPEVPVEEPEVPVVEPEVPVEEPEEPVVEPEVPVEEPEEPVAEPEVPVEEPEEPVAEPEVPVEEPEEPVAEPEIPVEEPEKPVEEPELPVKEPEEPVAEPEVPEEPLVEPEAPKKEKKPYKHIGMTLNLGGGYSWIVPLFEDGLQSYAQYPTPSVCGSLALVPAINSKLRFGGEIKTAATMTYMKNEKVEIAMPVVMSDLSILCHYELVKDKLYVAGKAGAGVTILVESIKKEGSSNKINFYGYINGMAGASLVWNPVKGMQIEAGADCYLNFITGMFTPIVNPYVTIGVRF